MGAGNDLPSGWWKLPALSGVLVGLSYFPGPFLPLNLAGFVPLLFWLDRNPDLSGYARLKAGFVFGWLVHLTSLHFMYSMLEQSWLAALLYLGFSAGLGVRISLTVALMGWLRRRTGLSFALLLPLCWIPFEWLQSWGDLRMTGEHYYHTVAGYPFLIQFVDLLGPYSVGAALLAINGLVFQTLKGRASGDGRRPAIALGVLLALILGYDAWAWNRPDVGPTLRVAFVQPNIPLDTKRADNTAARQWQKLRELTLDAAEHRPDLIVWPESARPLPLYHVLDRPDSFAMVEVQALARQVGVPIVTGVEYFRIRDKEDYELYNAAVAVDAEGEMLPDWGAKIYLVPFVEATPFRSIFGPLVQGRGGEWQWVAGSFEPGPHTVVLDVAGTRVGVLVCYEQLFPDLARNLRFAGAELQVVITNDAWFGRSLFQAYQANAARMRAIENRSALVRVANTGISGFVDSRGRYHHRTELFEEAVEVHDVVLSSRRTLYDTVGNLIAWLTVAGLLTAVVVGRGSDRELSV